MDLKQAIACAIENNPELKTALLDKTVRLHELHILKQKFSPQLLWNMSATVQREIYYNQDFDEKKLHSYPSLTMLTPIGTQIEIFTEQNIGYEQYQKKSGTALHVMVEQPLLQGRRKVVNTWSIENATILNEIQELLHHQAIEHVIYNVIVNYHALVLANENIRLHERWLMQSQRFYETLNCKVAAGRAPLSDLTSSKLQVNQAQSYLDRAKFEYRQTMRKLVEYLGSEEEEIEVIQDFPIKKEHINFQENEFVQIIADNDIETKIINLNKARTHKQLIVAKDQQLVDLRLRGDLTLGRYHIYGEDNFYQEFTDNNIFNAPFVHQNGNYSAQLLLSIPITGKDQRYHQVLAAKIELKKLEDASYHHQKHLIIHARNLLEQISLQKRQEQLSANAVMLAQKNYDDALLKLEAGRTSMFEVSMLQERLHDAQMQYNVTLIAYLDMMANLEYNAGLLTKKWLT